MCMSSGLQQSTYLRKEINKGSKKWTSFCLAGVVFYTDQSSNNPLLLLFSTYSWRSLIQQRTSFSPASEQWIKEWENLILKQPGSYEHQRLSSRRCIPLFWMHKSSKSSDNQRKKVTVHNLYRTSRIHYALFNSPANGLSILKKKNELQICRIWAE